MLRNKISKVGICLLIIVAVVFGLMKNVVNAADTSGRTVKIGYYRYIKDGTEYRASEKGYAITQKGSPAVHPIYQILSVDGSTVKNIDLYCLNAEYGQTWNDPTQGIGKNVEYETGYDLVTEKGAIADLADSYKAIVNNESTYKSVMWILDNMYTTSGTKTVDELLAEAGIEFDNTMNKYYYSKTNIPFSGGDKTYDTLYGVVDGYTDKIPEELVMAVQQAVIWHFTNGGSNPVYNNYDAIKDGENNTASIEAWLQYFKGRRSF